jgi:hypothetical protein
MLLLDRRPAVRSRPLLVAAAVTMLAPAGAMAWVVAANWQRVISTVNNPSARAADLQNWMADVCVVKWNPELCDGIDAGRLEAARARRARGETKMDDAVAGRVGMTDADGALLNSRGLDDRAAIGGVAWRVYSQTTASRIFGIGLGTFYATSGPALGMRAIIHNTAEWFLVELGPFGLCVLVWLLARTAMGLWRAWRSDARDVHLLAAIAAGLAAWAAFSIFNEAFYLRHFWVLLILADRLAELQSPIGLLAPSADAHS